MQGLRLFTDVARCHSYSQAAALHGITQSAASQRISQLEKKLGVVLLDRSVRPLALTEAGRIYLEGCEDVLQRYDRLVRKLSALRDDPSGTVRVAAIYSAGIELLERIRTAFEADHTRVHVEIEYLRPDEIHRMVLEGEADLGIVSYPDRFRKVSIIELREELMVVVCPADHPLAALRTVTPQQLTPYSMVGFDLDLPVGRRIKDYLKENHGHPETTHRFDNLDTLKSAVSVTDAFTILPKRTVIREVESGALAMLKLEPRLTRSMGAIYRSRSGGRAGLPPAVAAFAQCLIDSAGPDADAVGSLVPEGALAGK